MPLKISRCSDRLYAAVENFKPLEYRENIPVSAGSFILDEHHRPLKAARDCSESELKGKIMVVPFKSVITTQTADGAPTTPVSPRKKSVNRGAFLFLELTKVNLVTLLYTNFEQIDNENLNMSKVFSDVEKEFLTKIDSK
jgi:hypothetical protein